MKYRIEKYVSGQVFFLREFESDPLSREAVILTLMREMCQGMQVPHRLLREDGGKWVVIGVQNPHPGRSDNPEFLAQYTPTDKAPVKPTSLSRRGRGGGTARAKGRKTEKA